MAVLRSSRRGGFEALLPKPRADRGQSRSLPAPVVDVLLGTKEGNPALSVQLVIREAWVIYLALPFSLHPSFVVLPLATLFALSVAVTASTFKKYL